MNNLHKMESQEPVPNPLYLKSKSRLAEDIDEWQTKIDNYLYNGLEISPDDVIQEARTLLLRVSKIESL
jgi:hypothetical protein